MQAEGCKGRAVTLSEELALCDVDSTNREGSTAPDACSSGVRNFGNVGGQQDSGVAFVGRDFAG